MKKHFRDYNKSDNNNKVVKTYKKMLEKQTLKYVLNKKKIYQKYPNIKKHIWVVFDLLDNIIDESDPDTDLPQIIHAYQTAQALQIQFIKFQSNLLKTNLKIKDLFRKNEWRYLPEFVKTLYDKKYINELYAHICDWSWLPVVGLIHDLGKVIMLPKFGKLKQWSVVGDTFPVGCLFTNKNVFYYNDFRKKCKDFKKYNSHYGIYSYQCGLEKLHMSYGHDEYLASVLEKNNTNLPKEAIYIIRFHSFYAWHTSFRHALRGYTYFASDYDWKMLPLLKLFQQADLYSKIPEIPETNNIKEIYNPLFCKYGLNKEMIW